MADGLKQIDEWPANTKLKPGAYFTNMVKLIPAWISNYIYFNVWDEITYHSTLYWVCGYLSMLGLKVTHVNGAPGIVTQG